MSVFRIIRRSLVHHWRINAAVALGVCAATAVLTGALLVGDSVRASLRMLALDRLGKIDEALIADRFFRTDLAQELAASEGFQKHYSLAVPAVVFPSGSVERQSKDGTRRAAGVLVFGCDGDFWKLGQESARPKQMPQPEKAGEPAEIVLNQPLAEELGISVSDLGTEAAVVTLRIPRLKQVSGESPLGRKVDQTRNITQLKVVDIIPAESLGRFSLYPSQNAPRNAYVAAKTLQEALDQEGKANAIFVAGRESTPPGKVASRELAKSLHPTLADYGFSLKHVRRMFKPAGDAPEEPIFDYFSFSTERMMLDRAAENTAEQAFATDHAQGVLTYLANSIAKTGSTNAIPYSTITAIDSIPGLGPLLDEQGEPIALADKQDDPDAPAEIALTSWAASDLSAQVGDEIEVSFFDPERTHGDVVEKTEKFRLKFIVPLTEPKEPFGTRKPAVFKERPTLANDPDLTPEVPGITDKQSIKNWDAPFPFKYDRLRGQDDDYWNNHRTTPKAYISLAAGQRIWGSRFGRLTSLRIPAREGLSEEALAKKFVDQAARDGAALGLSFVPIKRNSLAASAGATPFDGLFLALSFFIIAAALLLVSLLFRLGIEQRASEIGILLALGWRRSLATRLFMLEGAIVAALGGLLGVAGGVGYAWLMFVGLRTIWLAAVVSPFMRLHYTPYTLLNLAIGYVSGVLVCVLTIAWSIRQTRKVSARQLLAGQVVPHTNPKRKRGEQLTSPTRKRGEPPESDSSPRLRFGLVWMQYAMLVAAPLLLLAAIGLSALATQLGGEEQAGAFMGSGAMVLTALIVFVSARFRQAATGRGTAGAFALAGLAARNAARNPGRSTLTIGLIAAASFLIVAVSAFRLAPTDAGTGGFDLVAQSSLPLYVNLDTPAGRKELLADQAPVLEGGHMFSLRLQSGDDASCNNMYQAARPRVLGVTAEFIEHFDTREVQHFAWAGSAAQSAEEKQNPWRLLLERGEQSPDDGAVPVVIDKNTAMYGLKLFRGIGEEFSVAYEDGSQVRFRVAGLLANSILQGSLLIGEEDFKRHFPRVSGYRFFLVQSPEGETQPVSQALEDKLSDQGFDASDARELLVNLLAVQNTYLSTFQALGGLGLLLGTLGLAAVQMRSVLERRGELALLRATGFRRWRLAEMVMLENGILLVSGLAAGVFAALVAVLPHWLFGGASIPFLVLAATLAVVLGAGLASGLWAVRATLRAPLLAALRGE